MNISLDRPHLSNNNASMTRKERLAHKSVIRRIIKRSPHLSPEEVAQAAERIICG